MLLLPCGSFNKDICEFRFLQQEQKQATILKQTVIRGTKRSRRITPISDIFLVLELTDFFKYFHRLRFYQFCLSYISLPVINNKTNK